MSIEITLTFGKDGLRISQKLNSDTLSPGGQTFVEQKRLKANFTATKAATTRTPAGSVQVLGGNPRDPGGPGGNPRDPGGRGGDASPTGSAGTVSLIGPIVITTCSCLKHDHEKENKEEERNAND